jgi:deazaflavin-dependent oxidoreductase (nitroreductase family)
MRLAERAIRSRALTRAPIVLYRLGLGFVFGTRLLMLEHTGRRTGARRFVVLEVIDHPDPDRYVVASGFGERAQWFRNVQAQPRVRISTSRHRAVSARAHRLPGSQADMALQSYIARHPAAWSRLGPTLERTLGQPVHTTNTALPMVEFLLTFPQEAR